MSGRQLKMTRAELKAAVAHVPRELGAQNLMKLAMQTRRANAQREHEDQAEIFRWAAAEGGAEFPELRTALFHAVPNGGSIGWKQGKKMKREGRKAGVSDMALDVARGGFFFAKIEQKAPGQRPSEEQIRYAQLIRDNGGWHRFSYSADETKALLTKYLSWDRTVTQRIVGFE